MSRPLDKIISSQSAVLALFVVIALSLGFNTFKVIQRNYELQQNVDNLADEVALIEVQNQNLEYNIEYYKSDSYLEVESKRRFNVVGKDEHVIFLPKDSTDESSSESAQLLENSDIEHSNFDKWMIFFSGKDRG